MATTTTAKTQTHEVTLSREAERNRYRKLINHIVLYIILVFIALLILLPMFWMLSTSLKPKSQLFLPQIYWIPKRITWENYTNLLSDPSVPIVRWFLNSIGIAVVSTALILGIDALAAYAYARMEFPGRKILFAVMLATLFMPGLMFLIPNFLTIYNLGLLNS